MKYSKILKFVSSIFNLNLGIEVLERPKGAEYWAFSETSNSVYKIYVGSWKKDKTCAFGFWKYDEDMENASKKALMHLIPTLKWEYKTRLKKWLRLK